MAKNNRVIISGIALLSLEIFLTTFRMDVYGSEFPVSTASLDQIKPCISCGTTNLLAVWEDYRNSSTGADIWGQLIDFNGNLIGTNFLVYSKTYDQSSPVVAWGNNLFFVAWMQGVGSSNFYIYGQLLNSSGNIVVSEIPISTRANCGRPAISFGSKDWLVVWADFRNGSYSDIYGQFIDVSGSLIDTAFPISNAVNSQLNPSVSWSEDKKAWLVVWEDIRSDTSDIWGQIIDTLGKQVGSNFPICQAVGNQRYVSVASNGTSWLASWSDYRSDSVYDIYAQYIDNSGTLIGSNVAVAETAGCNLYSPQVCWNGSRWVMVWVRYNKIVNNEMSVSNSTENAWYPSLTAIGNNCVVVWQDDRNTPGIYDIYANLFTPAGIEDPTSNGQNSNKIQKLKAYPNPFIHFTIIRLQLTVKSLVSLRLYDITGRIVKTLVNEEKQTGSYSINFNAKGLLSGIYFAELKAGEFKDTKKLVLMK